MVDRLFLLLLVIFLLLTGLLSVTTFDITWSEPIRGFSALAAGCYGIYLLCRR